MNLNATLFAQAVAHQVDGDDRNEQSDARIERNPVIAREHVAVAVGDEQAERRLGDRHAETEERQRRFERDGVRDLHGGHHDQRRRAGVAE